MGGVINTITNAVSSIFGGGGSRVEYVQQPDYEAERLKKEEETRKKQEEEMRRNKAAGMGKTILGGSLGDDNQLSRKKLLGE